MSTRSRWWMGICLGVLVGCGDVAETPPDPLHDDGGRYTVSARKDFTLGSLVVELRAQALGTPALGLELINYNAASTGVRSRGVLSVVWPSSDVPLRGTVRLGIETADGTLVASYGVAQVTGGSTLSTPYSYQPSERLCVTLDAKLRADTPSGDAVKLSLQQRVCEETAQTSQQDVLLASLC